MRLIQCFFSKDVQQICEQSFVMDVLIGFVTIFIVAVMIWLIFYMMRQSFKYRSKEMSLYMLFGLKQKEIFKNYTKRNNINGSYSICFGSSSGENY